MHEDESEIQLGFLEEAEPGDLHRRHFPTKVRLGLPLGAGKTED